MGLLSTIGKIAGAAIGSAIPGVGTVIGGAIGGAIGGGAGKVVEKGLKGGSKSSGATQSEQMYISAPKVSLNDIRNSTPSAMAILGKREESVKVAKAVGKPDFGQTEMEKDPWLPLNEWWVDLGGDPGRLKPIDDTRF